MTTQDKVRVLSTITTRDESGRHFYERYDADVLDALEADGDIEIYRPIHEATGLPYDSQYHELTVTEIGRGLVETYPEYWGEA